MVSQIVCDKPKSMKGEFAMRPKKVLTVVGIICLVLMVVCFTAGGVQAQAKGEVIKLKLANYFPPTGGQSLIFEEFIKDVEARTNGRISIQYLAGGSLLSGPGMYKGIESGIADIGYSNAFYTAGRMLVTEFGGLPFGYTSAYTAAHVMNDFYHKVRPKEWDGVKVLFIHGSNPTIFLTTKPIKTLEDLKGQTLRAPGSMGDVISALGGTPAPTPMVEAYEAISKNVIQGAFLTFEGLKTWRLSDVTKYTTNCWQVATSVPFYLIMNKNSYKKLPPDLKEIFDTVVGQYVERVALTWNQIDIEGKNFGAAKGVQFIELPDQEVSKWTDAVKPVFEAWVKKLVGIGYAEPEVRGWITFIKDRLDYYTKKQIEYCIPSPTGPAALRPENIAK